jgi:hypothetical protein
MLSIRLMRAVAKTAGRVLAMAGMFLLVVPPGLISGKGTAEQPASDPMVIPAARATESPWEGARTIQSHVRRGLLDARYVSSSGEWVTADDVEAFLEERDSPMSSHSELIVAGGNLYDVDPRLVVSISGIESGFGKYCRGHNAWGWNAGRTHWPTWEEAIVTYISRLAVLYPDRESIPSLATRYNPAYAEGWGRRVGFVWQSFDQQARAY